MRTPKIAGIGVLTIAGLAAFASLYLLRDLDCFSFDEWRASAKRRVPGTA